MLPLIVLEATKKICSRQKNNKDNDEKRKNLHLQIEIIE